MSVLAARGLRKAYDGVEVVAGIDLAIEPGECFGLLGPNGAGKTTTLRLCLGLMPPDAGEIRLLDEPVPQHACKARQRVGVVPQTDALDPDFTVEENLTVYARYFGIPEASVRTRIAPLLEFAGLAGRARAPISTLSGGMKRRLTLARALVNEPRVLFLDEPTASLDPQARHLIWERLRQLKQEGATLLLTTHFMEEAERLCDRIAIMDQGRIIVEGSPRELIGRHVQAEVLEIHGSESENWRRQFGHLAERVERAGETLFCYAADVGSLIRTLAAQPGLSYLHRQANLEDVFLKLTGRDLRD